MCPLLSDRAGNDGGYRPLLHIQRTSCSWRSLTIVRCYAHTSSVLPSAFHVRATARPPTRLHLTTTHPLGLVPAQLVEADATAPELLEPLENAGLLLLHLLGDLGFGAMQLPVDVHGVIDHMGRPQQPKAAGGDVGVRVRGNEAGGDEGIGELKQREHHVQVEVGRDG